MNNKPLTLAVDMYGCPNRCLHCWLSHMPNRTMEPDADRWIVDQFKPYFDHIEFFSWLREPDFCPDYRSRWERDKILSVNAVPPRFELASFWRLSRDPGYVSFLKDVGVGCVQLTFFGMDETTDRYVGRKGAFQELLEATEILLDNQHQEMNEEGGNEAYIRTAADGIIIGFIIFKPVPFSSWFFEETGGVIREFWIAEAYRSQGNGADLLKLAENRLAARDIHMILLTTDTAEQFYLRHGFQKAPGMKAKNDDPVFIKRI